MYTLKQAHWQSPFRMKIEVAKLIVPENPIYMCSNSSVCYNS